MKLPQGLVWARVKGGHRVHILDRSTFKALCGHAPGESKLRSRMRDRTGWVGYAEWDPDRSHSPTCAECLALYGRAVAEIPPGKRSKRPRIALQEGEDSFPLPRPATRSLGHPWPFPESVVEGRGLVKNVTPSPSVGNPPSVRGRRD